MPKTLQTIERVPQWLSRFPWRTSARTLAERFGEDRLGQTAASLTFTTLLSLVPFVTVALALFTAFPIFAQMQEVLQRWLMQSLIPESISRPVMGYLTQFAAKASGLGALGFGFLMVTALSLILTMDRTLNTIWRVRRLRPLGQRVLIYWAAITLGPLVLAASLALTTSVASAASHSLRGTLPGGARLLFGAIEFLVLAGGMAALYRYVPNTLVQWRHAGAGGVFVAAGMSLAKKGLGWYLASVPTYSVIYGTFATLPILLLWIYLSWVIVLMGAVVAAYLPSLLAGARRPVGELGRGFVLAVEVLQQLARARATPAHGLAAAQLAQALGVDELHLAPVLQQLTSLDWIAQANESAAGAPDRADARYLLLADPQATPMEPLVERLLIARSASLEGFWSHTGLRQLRLADVLGELAGPPSGGARPAPPAPQPAGR